MGGGGDSEAWDCFENEAVAIEEVSDNGAEGCKDTFGISFAFAGPIMSEGLAGKAHEE